MSMLRRGESTELREGRTSYADYAGQIKSDQDHAIFLTKSQQQLAVNMVVKPEEVKAAKRKGKKSQKSKKDKTDDLKKELVMHEHMEDLAILLDRLKTNPETGMTDENYETALKRYGKNKMTPPPTTPEWVKFLKEITTGFSLLLWAGGVLCFVSFGIQRGMSDVYI